METFTHQPRWAMCTASVIAQHMTKWSQAHYDAACKMAAYVAHHEHGLTFTASQEGLELVSYADSDWGSHDVSRGGQVHMWMGAAVAFSSKKTLSFPSTAAAETQNAAAASTYAMGLRALLEDTPTIFRPGKPYKLVGFFWSSENWVGAWEQPSKFRESQPNFEGIY